MADEDEIDILGDFSFNSCLAQNNQGIPSCSDREDTVHPQWLLDSTATNWYDNQNKNNSRTKDGPLRKLSGNNSTKIKLVETETSWSQEERDILNKEMEKYGQNSHKIAESLKSKSVAEIQALIEVEHGVNLKTQAIGIFKPEDYNIPVVQEEVILDDIITIQDTIHMVSTALPTIPVAKKGTKKKSYVKSSKSLLKPNILDSKEPVLVAINPSEIFYDDDINIGSTEYVGTDIDAGDAVLRNLAKQHKERVKGGKKIGNHRRKVSRNYDKSKSKDLLKSPQGRQRIDSGVSEDAKSPKMQIVLGSGQALPVSEGEQVIKIEKKKDSEPESDIEIDIDSDTDNMKEVNRIYHTNNSAELCEDRLRLIKEDTPVAVPLRKFEPMPKRRKRINLDGGGGCTIMHTAAGDLYEVAPEPRRERPPRKPPIHLIRCRVYNDDKPAPCTVSLNVSALIAMDAHAHTSRGEVMGLLGGVACAAPPPAPPRLLVAAYCRAAAANARTHCDMDPVSQSVAAEALRGRGLEVCGWHHSHPAFPSAPSALDLRSQRALQAALERAPPHPHAPHTPFLALITSQHWPPGRDASQYTCFRVEEDGDSKEDDTPAGYQLSVRVEADVCVGDVPRVLRELHALRHAHTRDDALAVVMARDVCPHAGITYLDKLISSVSRHLRSAGYSDEDAVTTRLLRGIREVFR
ncbi:PREDICTED: histone H2A deubiquitinase MYSM1-like [Papilio xuthus]|uniref:Histone H2A deubiquitinase MYSM1-like n=1 Tax=Papilio xuthus TaxID=66420 RepID=A0AAJ7ECJ1_PAPXU|nr:PREDICTED: histone H2A deubiquitinase MYSM1-like [Papilio xuthus]